MTIHDTLGNAITDNHNDIVYRDKCLIYELIQLSFIFCDEYTESKCMEMYY
jgi:hypothetical protein